MRKKRFGNFPNSSRKFGRSNAINLGNWEEDPTQDEQLDNYTPETERTAQYLEFQESFSLAIPEEQGSREQVAGAENWDRTPSGEDCTQPLNFQSSDEYTLCFSSGNREHVLEDHNGTRAADGFGDGAFDSDAQQNNMFQDDEFEENAVPPGHILMGTMGDGEMISDAREDRETKTGFEHTSIKNHTHLPHAICNRMLTLVMEMVNDVTFRFAQRYTPHVLVRLDIDCPRAVEVTKWWPELQHEVIPIDAVYDVNYRPAIYFSRMRCLRNCAVHHKRRIPVERLRKMVLSAWMIARLFQDEIGISALLGMYTELECLEEWIGHREIGALSPTQHLDIDEKILKEVEASIDILDSEIQWKGGKLG